MSTIPTPLPEPTPERERGLSSGELAWITGWRIAANLRRATGILRRRAFSDALVPGRVLLRLAPLKEVFERWSEEQLDYDVVRGARSVVAQDVLRIARSEFV